MKCIEQLCEETVATQTDVFSGVRDDVREMITTHMHTFDRLSVHKQIAFLARSFLLRSQGHL